MAKGRRPAVNPDIICRREGDEAILFNPSTEKVKAMNYTGLLLWNLCDGEHSRHDMVAKLAAEFSSVDAKILAEDVDEFLSELDKLGYLERRLVE